MNLANSLAEKLAVKLGYDDEKRKVMAYGLGAAIQMLELLLIAIIFGLVFDCLWECMILFWGVGLLRRTTGGTHCNTYMACIMTSSLSICLLALFCRYMILPCFAKHIYVLCGIIPAFGLFGLIAWKRVPLASPNKPITNPAKVKRLRKQCFLTMLVYLAISIVLLAFDWNNGRNISCFLALITVLYWQCFTLTSWSNRLAGAMDRLFANEST